jgi:hypothetical protein
VNGELVVPRDKFLVLGDNRDNSLDRYWGFLGAKDLIGRPLMILFSQEATPSQLANGLLSVPPVLLHPSTIRWSRMFSCRSMDRNENFVLVAAAAHAAILRPTDRKSALRSSHTR